MYVILDAGHGADTAGKRSPDGKIREYSYCRRLARAIASALKTRGVATHLLVPEERDVSLRERCRRANALARQHPDAMLVSVHLNAAGADGKWHAATGFSVFVAPNGSSRSRRLAAAYTQAARERGLLGNRCVPLSGYWVQSLAICRDTVCPAVLTENLFMDSMSDAQKLLSAEGFDRIVAMHVRALCGK